MTNEIDGSDDKASMPKSFGAAFREARLEAGYSIERAAVATRISASFIEALENQNFQVLPGEIFGRGFVRNLARAYGCDPKPLVAAYDLAIHSQNVEPVLDARDAKPKAAKPIAAPTLPKEPSLNTEAIRQNVQSAFKIAKPVLIAAPVLLGVLWIGQSVYQSVSSSREEVKDETTAETTAPVEPVAAVEPVAQPEVVPATPAPEQAQVGVTKGEGIEFVDITVKEPVDIRFGRDKDKQLLEKFEPQTYRLQFNEQLRLFVSDMSVVEIRFKGQVIPNRSKKGEARYMTFAVSDETLAKNREKPKL